MGIGTSGVTVMGMTMMDDSPIFWCEELCLDRWPITYKPFKHGMWTASLTFMNTYAACEILGANVYPTAFGVIDDFGNWVRVDA